MAAARKRRLKVVGPASATAAEAPRRFSVGETLRAERERRGWQLADVAHHLKIRRVHLEAIEEGRFAALPGPTYAVTFLRAHAEALGLDGEEMERRFRDEVDGLDRHVELHFPQPLPESRLPAGIVVLLSVVIAGIGYGAWTQFNQGGRVALPRVETVPAELAERAPAPAPRPPPASVVAAIAPMPVAEPPPPPPPAVEPAPATVEPAPAVVEAPPAVVVAVPTPPTPSPTTDGAPPSPPPSAPATAAAPPAVADAPPPETPRTYGEPAGGRVVIHAQADSWVQVREPSGAIVFMRILKAGESYAVPSRGDLLLTTGSAGALDIRVDGRSAPPIGRLGFVRRDVALNPERLLAGTAAPEPAPPAPRPAASPVPTPPAAGG